MTTILQPSQWGAKAATAAGNKLSAHPLGVAIHWEGPELGTRPHAECGALVRSIQDFHINTRGWANIAYNLLVCEHGVIFVGRGKGAGSAANGTTAANLAYYAICALTGKGDKVSAAMRQGLQEAAALCRSWGAGKSVAGHRDLFATECPGDELYADVKAGRYGPAADVVVLPVKTTKTPVKRPNAPAFPLPRGWYFGPSTGPKASVSGYYSHRADLKRWQQRMSVRGWLNSKGQPFVADGLYGPETARVAKLFQRQVGLDDDGLVGVDTWTAAWSEPIT